MKVLVIGGGGFLGSGITRKLIKEGNEVSILGRKEYPEFKNLVKEKTSEDGKKLIKVPFLFVFPDILRGAIVFPFLNSTLYSFLSLNILSVNFSDKALTTETPTP